jgi:branched-chain amino acid aminotransferase
MNGRCVRWDEATVHVSAHALHYGSGVFKGVRCYESEGGPALFRQDAHLERLYYSAAACGMEIPSTREELGEAVCEAVARNEFRRCYVRPICFYGSRSLGVNPRGCPVEVAVMAWPWAAYLGDAGLSEGVRVTVSPWLKFDARMMPTTAKACGQ